MNNAPFLSGVNTKQLSNQMLELTKVINELKDVLIQQVSARPAPSFLPTSARNLALSGCPRSKRRPFSETPSRSARPAVRLAHSRVAHHRWLKAAGKHPSVSQRSGRQRGGEAKVRAGHLFPWGDVHGDGRGCGVWAVSRRLHRRRLQLRRRGRGKGGGVAHVSG